MKEITEIYGQMLDTFEEKTGFAMDDTADLAVRLYAAAAELQALYIYADWALRQSFPQNASGVYLDYHGQLRGITRRGGKKAVGVLRFKIDSARTEALSIAAGVVCTTAGLVRFVTDEECVIEAGKLHTDVPAHAETEGTAGNVPAGSVVFMTKAPAGVTGVTNPAAFQGGSSEEDDEALRARILDSFIRLPNGANGRCRTRAWRRCGSSRAMRASARWALWSRRRTACRSRHCFGRSRMIWTACVRSRWMSR